MLLYCSVSHYNVLFMLIQVCRQARVTCMLHEWLTFRHIIFKRGEITDTFSLSWLSVTLKIFMTRHSTRHLYNYILFKISH